MEIDYVKLARAEPGERPYKAYRIDLEKGYVRLMACRIDKDGMAVSVNYYGRLGGAGGVKGLTMVTETRQSVRQFEEELARFAEMLKGAGIKIEVFDIGEAKG